MESPQKQSLVKLHPEVKDISFRHFFTIANIFRKNVPPILGINYFSLMIIDSHQVLTFYSNRPSLEINHINQNTWEYNCVFDTKNHQDGAFYFWDELYADCMKNALIKEREEKYGFTFGFYLMKKIKDVFVIYSFATKRNECREVYKESRDILYSIGDYFFYDLKPIHKSYLSHRKNIFTQPFSNLKLVVNNTIKE